MQNGDLIARLRNNKNMSQKDMATYLGIALSTYKTYELNGQLIKLRDLNLISELFKVSLDALVNLTTKTCREYQTNKIDYNRLGYILIYVRRKNNLSQTELAKMFKISAHSIIKYENDPSKVSVYYLYLFAKKFNISIDYMCGKTQKKEILF